MRVNMEDSLILDGHVPRLAKAMGWTEREAGGALWMLYRATQAAGIITESIDRIITVSILAFDDDDQARRFVHAMATARLAEVTGDRVRIFGNEKHVKRFADNRDRNVKGGKARAAQLQQKHVYIREPQASLTLATGKPQASTPNSDLLTPSSNTRNQIRDRDHRPAPKARESVTDFARVVDCWFREHVEVYGKKPPWGALQGKQLGAIMRKAPGVELLDLIPQFFHGPYQDSIDAGHPLSDGFACLAKRVDMLRADLAKPERRIAAARLRGAFREVEKKIGVDDEMEKARAMLRADDQLKLLGDGNG